MGKRIVIVGAGAVGGYFGAYLTRAGEDVILIDPWPEHVETIRRQGLSLTGMTDEETMTVPLRALHVTELQGLSREKAVDIAIIATKSYDTAWATLMIAPYLAPDGYVVSAQNGINEERIAAIVGWGRVVGCMVGNNFTVDLYEPGQIRRTMPRSPSVYSLQVGEVHGRITPRIRELEKILAAVDTISVTTNLWGVRWSKLCVNGMRNGVSAATGLGGNARDAHDQIRKVVIHLAGEAVRVGEALGYELEPFLRLEPNQFLRASDGDAQAMAEVDASLLAGTKGSVRSNLQRPSMAQDMEKGRKTEIDEINGFIAAKGAEVGISTPTHAALTQIVKDVERGVLSAKPENLFPLLP
ncbi:2-dehydropantoate 2-reductase [Rhodoligotrophos appendicifer]|uniref:ketopantoate reductase family protein n=1 Tax=Rhodoligotrophos appendicifer TaxID=987056 RepID=UPI0014789408|nr:2-dehydropantoate 2-reductase [Rhodoligotrophos appendicifer]